MLSEDNLVALVAALIGSGGLGGFAGWLSQHLSRRKTALTRNDLKPIEDKLDRDYRHFDSLDDQVRDITLIVLRQCLFAHPHDRNAHESQLQSGEQYLKLGGNGVGHIRLDQLKADYERRLENDDWDYTHDRP